MSFNEHYDETTAKGLCWRCKKNTVEIHYCEKSKIKVESLYCWVCESHDDVIDLTEHPKAN